MNSPLNYQEIAKRFWDLWQDQVAHMMNDKEFVRTMLEMMQSSPLHATPESYAKTGFSSAPRSPAASESGHDAVDLLSRRLEDVENRLRALESAIIGLVGRAPSPTSKPVVTPRARRTTRKSSRK